MGNRGALNSGKKRALLWAVKQVLAQWSLCTKQPEDAEPDFTIRWLEQGSKPYYARLTHREDKAYNRAFQAANLKELFGVDDVLQRSRGRPRKLSPALIGFSGIVRTTGSTRARRTWLCIDGEICIAMTRFRNAHSYWGRNDSPAWFQRQRTAKWMDVYDGSREEIISLYRKCRLHVERRTDAQS